MGRTMFEYDVCSFKAKNIGVRIRLPKEEHVLARSKNGGFSFVSNCLIERWVQIYLMFVVSSDPDRSKAKIRFWSSMTNKLNMCKSVCCSKKDV